MGNDIIKDFEDHVKDVIDNLYCDYAYVDNLKVITKSHDSLYGIYLNYTIKEDDYSDIKEETIFIAMAHGEREALYVANIVLKEI